MPPRFWEDEFVLGFLGFMIGFHAEVTSGYRLSQEDKGRVLSDVFTALSNMNGAAITRQFTRLAIQNPQSPDFEKGADNASICAFASIGKVSELGRPYIEKAKELAARQDAMDDPGAIGGFLFQMLFYEPLWERFSDVAPDGAPADADLLAQQDEVAIKAIVAGKAIGAKTAKEAAELAAGRLITAEEWQEIRDPWERNWPKVKDEWIPRH